MDKQTSTTSRLSFEEAHAAGLNFLQLVSPTVIKDVAKDWVEQHFPVQLDNESQEQFDALIESMTATFEKGAQSTIVKRRNCADRAVKELTANCDALKRIAVLFFVIKFAITTGKLDEFGATMLADLGIEQARQYAERAEGEIDYFLDLCAGHATEVAHD